MKFFRKALRKAAIYLLPGVRFYYTMRNHSKPRYLILNYHGVVNDHRPELSKNHLSALQFKEHLEYFHKHFKVISLQAMIGQFVAGIRPNRPTIAITFDDGYENNYTNAYPLLKIYNFPASIFVTAQAIDYPEDPLWYDAIDLCKAELDWEALKRSDYNNIIPEKFNPADESTYHDFKQRLKLVNDEGKKVILGILLPGARQKGGLKNIPGEYWKLLSKEQLKLLAADNEIEIGSHALTHTNLDTLSEPEIAKELSLSMQKLHQATLKPVTSIAFPDGAYNEKVKETSFKVGYRQLFAVDYRNNYDKPENNIFPRYSISNTTVTASVIISIYRAFSRAGF